MQIGRRRKQIFSALACLAILLGALAQTIPRSLQRGPGNSWVEVCTVLGAKLVRAEPEAGGGSGPTMPGDHLMSHCVFCALHATAFAPPSVQPASVALTPQVFAVPRLFLIAPRTLHAWRPAQARAPPFLR